MCVGSVPRTLYYLAGTETFVTDVCNNLHAALYAAETLMFTTIVFYLCFARDIAAMTL